MEQSLYFRSRQVEDWTDEFYWYETNAMYAQNAADVAYAEMQEAALILVQVIIRRISEEAKNANP